MKILINFCISKENKTGMRISTVLCSEVIGGVTIEIILKEIKKGKNVKD